jgi:hypothetical protein
MSAVGDGLLGLDNVVGLAHERQGHVVGPGLHGRGHVGPVLGGQRGRRHGHAGQVHPLAGLDHPAPLDLAADPLALDVADPQADGAVVEQDLVALVDVGGQLRVDDRDLGLGGPVGPGDQHDLAAWIDPDAVVADHPDPDLGPLEVDQHGQVVVELGRDRAHQLEPGQVVGPLAVGEVQPDHVQAGLDHAPQDVAAAGRRAEGGHDLGALGGHRARSLARVASGCDGWRAALSGIRGRSHGNPGR